MQGIDFEIPSPLIDQAARWDSLKRWERRELGQALRLLGLSYREIAAVIPVSKGTLSSWCRDIALSKNQQDALASRRPDEMTRTRVGSMLRGRALQRQRSSREAGRAEATLLVQDPLWAAGTVAYWAEGAKRTNSLRFSNSDPALVCLFVQWSKAFLGVTNERFTVSLHLHDGLDEDEAKRFWSERTGIPLSDFRKTWFKQEGSGHRKNKLYRGTASVRIRRSGDLFQRVMGWIDAIAATVEASRKAG
jgi:transposase